MDLDLLASLLYATFRTGTPILLVALGELICEKSGVLNLGQEGVMLMGAVTGFIVVSQFDSYALGIFTSVLTGIVMAAIFAFITLTLQANQVASGLALAIFGTGLSAFIGTDYQGQSIAGLPSLAVPHLSEISVIGPAFFQHDILVYTSLAATFLLWWNLKYARLGLILKAVGENPDAANALGLPVLKVRYLAVLFGGAMSGLAGAYVSLVYTPLWAENMTAGRGWIAVALVVFASWRISRVLLGAYLFGLASILHLVAQVFGADISPNLLAALPYAATIVVLVILSSNQTRHKLFAPLALAIPWHKSR
ncbi:ABC transporter permease [Alteromonas lipolytica]|uniref:ABC transporter permease n=1 Tax=Alteromonas lipolytica TaxID=1856405 RepID=A0A1E8FJ48_9ALTE|nr:ABC transporter permease [Alteromonas lipolytica]OFI35944.1 ABC transporter permease [Alteromonas lipolytica]GGF72337.1 ABC transporter permease [Alteromonas lipolytica]